MTKIEHPEAPQSLRTPTQWQEVSRARKMYVGGAAALIVIAVLALWFGSRGRLFPHKDETIVINTSAAREFEQFLQDSSRAFSQVLSTNASTTNQTTTTNSTLTPAQEAEIRSRLLEENNARASTGNQNPTITNQP